MAGLGDLQAGQFLGVGVDDGGEAAQQPRAVGGGRGGPAGLGDGGPYDGGVDLLQGGGRHRGHDLAGGGVEDLVLGGVGRVVGAGLVGHVVPHRRSKERRSSQSVTAASKASTSTRAMLR